MNKSFLISNKINVLIATMKKLDEIEIRAAFLYLNSKFY